MRPPTITRAEHNGTTLYLAWTPATAQPGVTDWAVE